MKIDNSQLIKNSIARWYRLRDHEGQKQLLQCNARYIYVPCGRRSGKTESVKRKKVLIASKYKRVIKFGAPTRQQAKRIFWQDIKDLAFIYCDWDKDPRQFISESELTITLKNGSVLKVDGLDRPERWEGEPLTDAVIDETGNVRDGYQAHILPALSDTLGSLICLGVPEGKNHYYDDCMKAKSKMQTHHYRFKSLEEYAQSYAFFHWFSSSVLPDYEINAARETLDELTFKQEYEAEFVSFSGICYYSFSDQNIIDNVPYDPNKDIILCFDFNVSPGVAGIIQEDSNGNDILIDEIYINSNSNTEKVTNEFIRRYHDHKKHIFLYGDASGGNKHSSGLLGSDWTIIKNLLYSRYGNENVTLRVPKSNPPIRARVNAMNSRIKSASGAIRFYVCKRCKYFIDDVQKTEADELGNPEKGKNSQYTHLTDAVGYYFARQKPAQKTLYEEQDAA